MSDCEQCAAPSINWGYWGEVGVVAEVTRLTAENEKLKKMVKDAYNAGFLEGMKEHTSSRGGIPWADSKFRVAITQEKRDD